MNFVDTSVWIEVLRASGGRRIKHDLDPLVRAGDTVLHEWIILELMAGVRANESLANLLTLLAPVQRLPLPEDGWARAWDLAARLRKKGVSASAADCLIATIAIAHGATLIHCDTDFELIAKHEKNLRTLDWTKLL